MMQVRFSIPEYDRALAEYIALVVKGVFDQDPYLRKISSGTTLHGGPRRNVRSPQPLDQPMITIQQDFDIPLEVIRNTDTDEYATLLYMAAKEYKDKLLAALFQGISEVTDAGGNVIDARGEPLTPDVLNDVLERMELSFDENGQPIHPMVVLHPDTFARLKDIQPTAEQRQRQAEIVQRKKAEHDAKKRSRRLS
jgi:hypothetical protein